MDMIAGTIICQAHDNTSEINQLTTVLEALQPERALQLRHDYATIYQNIAESSWEWDGEPGELANDLFAAIDDSLPPGLDLEGYYEDPPRLDWIVTVVESPRARKDNLS